jgi:hypothetical protein
LLDRAFRGFENPLPRTEVRGWHSSMKARVYPTASFSALRRGSPGLARIGYGLAETKTQGYKVLPL